MSPAATPFDIPTHDRSIPPLCPSTVCGVFLGMAVFLYRAPAQRSDTMPIVNHTTATNERLARALAHLRQAALLIEEAAPGIVEGLTPGAVAVLLQPLAAPDHQNAPSGSGSVRLPITDRATYCATGPTRPAISATRCRLGSWSGWPAAPIFLFFATCSWKTCGMSTTDPVRSCGRRSRCSGESWSPPEWKIWPRPSTAALLIITV